jgi:hypothetical protein
VQVGPHISGRYCFGDAIQPAIWALDLNPSLFRMLRTWLSTVRLEMKKLPTPRRLGT